MSRTPGPGVPEKARAHLFQAFQGGARPGGTGLGLAIAAELVRAHGGSIALVDQAGPGARFEMTLPDRRRPDGRNGGKAPAALTAGDDGQAPSTLPALASRHALAFAAAIH